MENNVTLHPDASRFGGTLPAIASKSFAHRLILLASLSDAPTRIRCATTSKDIEATISCMQALGTTIRREGDMLFITPAAGNTVQKSASGDFQQESKILNTSANPAETIPIRMNAGESGSTLRFLLPILGVLGYRAEIETAGRLARRPLSPLKEEMALHGTEVRVLLSDAANAADSQTIGKEPASADHILLSGRMEGGSFRIAGNISSQYITGLLIALPLAAAASTLLVTGKLESRPYVDITLSCLADFGIRIEERPQEDGSTLFRIPGGQRPHYNRTDALRVEGDWSNAAFFLAAGALSRRGVEVSGLRADSCQGDKKIVDILRRFGAELSCSPDAAAGERFFCIKKVPLKGTVIDASDIPDLVPILAAVAAAAEGITEFHHIERLRLKESDRVATVIDCITSLGGDASEEDGCLIIHGTGRIAGGTADSHNDHRIAMTAAVLSLIADGPVTIRDAGAVQKSYPGFFTDFHSLDAE